MIREIFDNMSTGIVILNRGAEVKFLNKYMKNFIKSRTVNSLEKNMLFGDLFTCTHTEAVGSRCGETVHCPKCPLRCSIPDVASEKQIVVFEKELSVSGNNLPNYYSFSMKPISDLGEDSILIEMFQIKNNFLDMLSNNHQTISEQLSHYKEISYTDSLTNLFNRNFYEENMESFYQEYSQVSLLILDMDGLKSINDNFGHQAGDDAIKKCASIIKNIIGNTGYSMRLGGDEFFVFLPKPLDQCIDFAQDLMNQAKENKISFSIGISSKKDVPEEFSSLFKRADDALYTAKKNGKGMLVIGR